MQGWLFINGAAFWQPERAEALLTSVPLVRHCFYFARWPLVGL